MSRKIGIIGGGLVGTLISILLAKKGYHVEVFEKRADQRGKTTTGGRSINLALSHRGIRALKQAGIFDQIEPLLIPMYGRQIHTVEGEDFQPYGKSDQYISSVPRQLLNNELMDEAERSGVVFHFGATLQVINPDVPEIVLQTDKSYPFDFIIGADGAFSSLRKVMGQKDASYITSEETLSHSYKELSIPAKNGDFAMDPAALHIWPRKKYMLIALPNPDRSFTCTLFLQDHGNPSFEKLKTPGEISEFLTQSFPDAIINMDNAVDQFLSNPQSTLQTIKTYPWAYKSCLLIGDAAHAIVPFYGQGMNSGFEDCRVFVELLDANNHDWVRTANEFQVMRKRDADAIAELALRNFREMSEDVIDNQFIKRKKLEKRLNKKFPDAWLPLYSMVTFSDIPYHEALKLGDLQSQAISKLDEGYNPMSVELEPIMEEFTTLKKAHY